MTYHLHLADIHMLPKTQTHALSLTLAILLTYQHFIFLVLLAMGIVTNQLYRGLSIMIKTEATATRKILLGRYEEGTHLHLDDTG